MVNSVGCVFSILFFFFSCFSAFAETDCPTGKHWVSSFYRKAYKRHDGTNVSAANVDGHCRLNPRGYDQWHQRFSNDRPQPWHYKESSKTWSPEEVERVLEDLSVLPDQIINLTGVKLHRMEKSIRSGNPATTNFKDVVLYDLAFQHKDSLLQILSHELAHVLFENLSEQEKLDFATAAGWKRHPKQKHALIAMKNKIFIQNDSRESLREDFANHIEHFLFKNESLKKESPSASSWIETRFGKNFRLQEGK